MCTRSITWAYEDDGSGGFPIVNAGCVQASSNEWFDFLGSWHLPIGATDYSESTCTTSSGSSSWSLVYTPFGSEAAKQLCTEAFGGWLGSEPTNYGYPVYGCFNNF